MTCTMSIPNQDGDLQLSWDPDDPPSVERAKAEFDRLRELGDAFYIDAASATPVQKLKPKAFAQRGALDVRPVVVRDFQPRARRQVAMRPMVGG